MICTSDSWCWMRVAEIAQLGERQTEDLKVPGSNPESSHELWIIPGLGNAFYFCSASLFLFLWVFSTIKVLASYIIIYDL